MTHIVSDGHVPPPPPNSIPFFFVRFGVGGAFPRAPQRGHGHRLDLARGNRHGCLLYISKCDLLLIGFSFFSFSLYSLSLSLSPSTGHWGIWRHIKPSPREFFTPFPPPGAGAPPGIMAGISQLLQILRDEKRTPTQAAQKLRSDSARKGLRNFLCVLRSGIEVGEDGRLGVESWSRQQIEATVSVARLIIAASLSAPGEDALQFRLVFPFRCQLGSVIYFFFYLLWRLWQLRTQSRWC